MAITDEKENKNTKYLMGNEKKNTRKVNYVLCIALLHQVYKTFH